jgi:ribosomal protein L37E
MNEELLITPEQIAHLQRLENAPLFDDEDLLQLAKDFPEDEENMKGQQEEEIMLPCSKCLEENRVSFDEKQFTCTDCGYLNDFDGEKIRNMQNAIYRKVFGEKPANSGNN